MRNKLISSFSIRKLYSIVLIAVVLFFQGNKLNTSNSLHSDLLSLNSKVSKFSESNSLLLKGVEFTEIQNDIEENELEGFELLAAFLYSTNLFDLGEGNRYLVVKEKARIYRKQPLYLLFCELKIHLA